MASTVAQVGQKAGKPHDKRQGKPSERLQGSHRILNIIINNNIKNNYSNVNLASRHQVCATQVSSLQTFSTCVVTIALRRDQRTPSKVKFGSVPTDPQQEPLGVGQHPIVEPSQCCRISHLIEMILQQFDEEASQHGCFWCHICLRTCDHHVDDGLGSVEAGVGSVPKLHHRCL